MKIDFAHKPQLASRTNWGVPMSLWGDVKGHGSIWRARGMRQRKNADREMQPKTFPSRPKRKRLFLLFPSLFLFTSLKIKMTGVMSGRVPAENPFSLSQEESIVPDTFDYGWSMNCITPKGQWTCSRRKRVTQRLITCHRRVRRRLYLFIYLFFSR